MENTIENPFKNRTNWANKTREKLKKRNNEIINDGSNLKPKSKTNRIAKSFKIYPGNISRTFDKRVNKLQVHFDDLDYEKNYVDSGKYIMFLMQFAEKFRIFELYKEVNEDGELDIESKKVKDHFNNFNNLN